MYNKSDSRIIIIGGSGLIGGSLNNILLKDGCKVISTYAKNPFPKAVRFDFTKDKLSQISEKFNSKDIFVILSAYSNPSWIAENKDQTFNLNVRSTINLINQISDIGAKIFFMSSVEIFDGSSEFNLENTKPNPLNYYGETKFLVEKYLQDKCKNYHILRTGWNVGINAKSRCVITLTYKTLLNDGAKMATDNTFTITHVDDLTRLISKVLFKLDKNILHLCSPEIISRNKLAQTVKHMSKKGDKMRYKEVLFSDIFYNEPRARLNNLRSKYDEFNDINLFRKAKKTIEEKVDFLDKII